jgi:[protein-PII] uridylyltransferase
MSIRSEQITNRRAIIDRRALVSALEEIEPTGDTAMRNALVRVLKPALEAGRAEIAARLDAHPTAGRDIASSYAFLTDQVLRLAYDFTTQRMYHLNNPTAGKWRPFRMWISPSSPRGSRPAGLNRSSNRSSIHCGIWA